MACLSKSRSSFLLGAAVALLSSTVDARAAKATPEFNCCDRLRLGYEYGFEHSPSDNYGHAIFRLDVEAASIATVVLTRTDGVGGFDIEIADSVSPGNWHRANVSGLIGRDTGRDVRPNFVLIPPSARDRTVYVHLYVADNGPGKWRIETRSIDLIDAAVHGLVTAGGQYLVEEFVKAILEIDSNSSEARNIGRAVGIGFSIIQGKNILEIGIDVVVNEIQLKLQDEFPNSRFIVLAVTNALSHTLQHLYGPVINGMTLPAGPGKALPTGPVPTDPGKALPSR
jgi:hypothetical protein